MNDLELISENKEVKEKLTSDSIFKHLQYINKLFIKHNISHWLVYGTLLGSIRQNDIIPYDHDFDLGIKHEDHKKVFELNTQIINDGYNFEMANGAVYSLENIKKIEMKWRVSYKICYNKESVGDLYIYSKFDDGYYRRYDIEENIYFWPNSTLPSYFFDNLTTSTVRDISFPSPMNSLLLLEHWYGPMWITPIKASSQDGDNHEDYDYYGNYKYSTLENLNVKLKEKLDKENTDITINKPNISKLCVKWISPINHIDWIVENENYIPSKLVKKQIRNN